MITQEALKELVHYNEKTGKFTWIKLIYNHPRLLGKEAGFFQKSHSGPPYRCIKINKSSYRAHRLAWLYFYGYMPKILDHINGNRSDNKISNLREVNRTQNAQNHTKKINKSGLPCGVRLAKGKYVARIRIDKTLHHLGTFETSEEARMCYQSYRIKFHDCPAYLEILK